MAPPAIPSRTISARARRMMSPLQGSASQCQTSVGMVVMVGGEQHPLAGARDGHDGAAVGGGEGVARERLLWSSERDLTAVEAEDAIPRARLFDVVGGDQEPVALAGEIGE